MKISAIQIFGKQNLNNNFKNNKAQAFNSGIKNEYLFDSVTFSGNKNKLAKIANRAENTAETVYALVKEADSVNEHISKTLLDSYGQYEKLMQKGEFLASGKNCDVISIQNNKNNDKIMSEYKNGELVKRTTIKTGTRPKVVQIEEFADDGNTRIVFHRGKIDSYNYTKGYEKTGEDAEKIDTEIVFIMGSPLFIKKDYSLDEDGTKTFKNYLEFIDGRPNFYEEGTVEFSNGSQEKDKYMKIKNGRPYLYNENGKNAKYGPVSWENKIKFADGKWQYQ